MRLFKEKASNYDMHSQTNIHTKHEVKCIITYACTSVHQAHTQVYISAYIQITSQSNLSSLTVTKERQKKSERQF